MYRYFYQLARRTIAIRSEVPFSEDAYSRLFCEEPLPSTHIRIHVLYRADVPTCTGAVLYQEKNFRFLQDQDTYFLQAHGGTGNHPVACTQFHPTSGEITVCLRSDFFPPDTNIQQLWRIVNLPFQLLQRGVLTLHSSSVRTDKGVILFCGRSGIGKSTQAALWREYQDAMTLNGDRNAIAFDRGVPFAYGLPFCGTSGICYRFAEPIRAIVALQQAEENHIVRLTGSRALLVIANNTIGLYYKERSSAATELLLHAASHIPVYQLSCTPDARAVDLLQSTLEGAFPP